MADVTISSVSILNGFSERLSRLTKVAVSLGQFLHATEDIPSQWDLAAATSIVTAGQRGLSIALEAQGLGNNIDVVQNGSVVQFNAGALVATQFYYVSPNAGNIALYSDILSGQFVTQVGYAESDQIFHFDVKTLNLAKP